MLYTCSRNRVVRRTDNPCPPYTHNQAVKQTNNDKIGSFCLDTASTLTVCLILNANLLLYWWDKHAGEWASFFLHQEPCLALMSSLGDVTGSRTSRQPQWEHPHPHLHKLPVPDSNCIGLLFWESNKNHGHFGLYSLCSRPYKMHLI